MRNQSGRSSRQFRPSRTQGDVAALEGLVKKLIERRSRLRDLITEFRESSRQPFPNWERAAGEGRGGWMSTGAASGMGRATAARFAGEGASVVIADLNTEGGESAVRECKENGGNAVFQQPM